MTRARTQQPRSLDVRAFCQDAATIDGTVPVAQFGRLLASLHQPPGDALVRWQAWGQAVPKAAGVPEWWLRLQAQATVVLQCQRCLEPMAELLQVERRFRFVEHEDEAERLDELIDDDVLVLEPRFDLMALVEDELLLALPLVPRHEPDCPEPLNAPSKVPHNALLGEAAAPEEPKPHPFAALAALRRGGGSGT